MVKLKQTLGLIFILCQFSLLAQEEEVANELITDRPDETEAPTLVPAGHLQIETGFFYSSHVIDGVEKQETGYNTTLLRYGLLENFELRLGTEILKTNWIRDGQEFLNTETGFNPLLLGGKVGIAQENGPFPEIGILGHLYLPFAASEQYQPATTGVDFRFAFSHTLSDVSDLSYNLGAEWRGDSPYADYIYALAYGYEFTDSLGVFAEIHGSFPEDDRAEHFFDAGLTYLLQKNLQVDIFLGTGLDNSQDILMGGGLSYRIPK